MVVVPGTSLENRITLVKPQVQSRCSYGLPYVGLIDNIVLGVLQGGFGDFPLPGTGEFVGGYRWGPKQVSSRSLNSRPRLRDVDFGENLPFKPTPSRTFIMCHQAFLSF